MSSLIQSGPYSLGRRLKGHLQPVNHLAVSPSGQFLASGGKLHFVMNLLDTYSMDDEPGNASRFGICRRTRKSLI